ncbi:MAG: hypothetical protein ABIQ16_21975 [Polyangiaceae bacterium]
MKEAAIVRSRSSLLGDLRIVLLGVWGFFRQCLGAVLTRGRSHELESGD